MKIGIISTMGGEIWAASEYLWQEAAMELLEDGHEVSVSIGPQMLQAKPVGQLEETGAKIYPRKVFINKRIDRIRRRKFSSFHSFFKGGAEVICVSQGSLLDMVWLPDLHRDLRRWGIPYVILTHFNADSIVLSSGERQLALETFQEAAYHFFVSKHNHLLANRQLAWEVKPSGIITGKRLRPVDGSPMPSVDGCIEMACLARLNVEWKGQDILLETLGQDQWRNENWRLTLYGSGIDRSYLESLVDFYGLREKVCFGGFQKDIDELWRKHHLHVLAARGEGGPLVTIEAMLRGRLCVTTDVGRNRAFIEDGVDGFLAEAPTAHSFSLALRRAWDKRGDWSKMSISAVRHANQFLKDDPVTSLKDKLLEVGSRP